MAAASAFSYAQAAKGQGATKTPAATAPANESNPQNTASEPGTGEKSAATASSVDMSDTTQDTATQSSIQEKQDLDSVSAVDSETRTESVPEKSPEQRRDDDGRRLDRPWRRNDKGTRSSSATTRSVDEHESRRPRKGKKGKSSEKQNGSSSAVGTDQESKTDETPKIELSEAPIPSVNIWQQRKEAQQSKAKPTDVAPRPQVNNHAAKPPAITDGGNSDPVTAPAVVANGSKPSQKAVESVKPERQASRGARTAVREAKVEAPPAVDDTSSWPTPEIAIKEDKKKPLEKGDRSEKEGQDEAKPRQKKEWVTYDYVPSVSFETQMPQMRNSKARGGAKGASSSRSAAATGSQQPSEKTNAAVSSAKGPENKERARETHSSANGTGSAPPQAKRAAADAPQTQARGEQKKPAAATAADKPKDAPSNQYSEHGPAHREGRSERGRGGYRGRGAHHGVHPHSQHQHQHGTSMGAPPFSTQAAMGSRSQGPYSPPPRQGHNNQMYLSSTQRGGRGGRNNGSSYHRMSLPNGSARIPPVETQFPPYNYAVPPMSAVPFQQVPYWDNMVVAMVRNQIEYYFSIENLCKDMYLRKRMDSQGFVPLMFVTAFKRMRELSPEMPLVRSVCEESTEIDYVLGEDDIERLRRRNGWQSFVLPLSDRDELARNPGPMQLTFKNRSYAYPPHFNGMGPQGVTSPPVYQPQGFMDEHHMANGVNGHSNGNGNGNGASQLSAEVPDFSPSHSAGEQAFSAPAEGINGQAHMPVNGLPNGVHTQ